MELVTIVDKEGSLRKCVKNITDGQDVCLLTPDSCYLRAACQGIKCPTFQAEKPAASRKPWSRKSREQAADFRDGKLSCEWELSTSTVAEIGGGLKEWVKQLKHLHKDEWEPLFKILLFRIRKFWLVTVLKMPM